MQFEYTLYEVRKKKGLTQRMLAKRSGVSAAMISLIERGKRKPTIDTLLLLAMALGVKILDLVHMKNQYAEANKYLET